MTKVTETICDKCGKKTVFIKGEGTGENYNVRLVVSPCGCEEDKLLIKNNKDYV